jgi:hypothetical protein
MFFIGLFILELFILYLLSRNIYVLFFQLLHHATRSKKITIHLLAFLFLPGTLLHEAAHWLAAKILFVSTGSMTLIPKMDEKGSLRLGSVMIAKTDIIRRFIIGAAPVILGVSIILAMLYFAFKKNIFNDYLVIVLLGYLVFEVGNTMFSSKKDMEGALSLILAVLVTGVIFYFLGLFLGLSVETSGIIELLSSPILVDIFRKGSLYLLIPMVIDLLFIIILKPVYGSGNNKL